MSAAYRAMEESKSPCNAWHCRKMNGNPSPLLSFQHGPSMAPCSQAWIFPDSDPA